MPLLSTLITSSAVAIGLLSQVALPVNALAAPGHGLAARNVAGVSPNHHGAIMRKRNAHKNRKRCIAQNNAGSVTSSAVNTTPTNTGSNNSNNNNNNNNSNNSKTTTIITTAMEELLPMVPSAMVEKSVSLGLLISQPTSSPMPRPERRASTTTGRPGPPIPILPRVSTSSPCTGVLARMTSSGATLPIAQTITALLWP
ncbi:hypothetical protein FRB91_008784 [Serendipita sp. 411]|nr:hypothetical protein FRB91_008784 [Serendipita sp. 411]